MIDARRRVLDPRERKEVMLIGRLQSMNVYPQLVQKLTAGESARSVSRWAMTVGVDGAPRQWGFEYWMKHIMALRREVIDAKDKLRAAQKHPRGKIQGPRPPTPEAVLATVAKEVEKKSLLDYIPQSARDVMSHVVAADKQLKAIHLLQYEAYTQIGRIEKVKEIEKTMPFMLPTGGNEVAILNKIASTMIRLELGYEMIRGRRGYMPQTPTEPSQMSPFARRMMDFDEVDRGLMRQLTAGFIEMVSGGESERFEAVGLEADAAGTDSAIHPDAPGNVEPPIGESSGSAEE